MKQTVSWSCHKHITYDEVVVNRLLDPSARNITPHKVVGGRLVSFPYCNSIQKGHLAPLNDDSSHFILGLHLLTRQDKRDSFTMEGQTQ